MVGDGPSREKEKEEACAAGGACGKPHNWRKPNRLLTLHVGDTMREQVLFQAFGAPDGECDNFDLCAETCHKFNETE